MTYPLLFETILQALMSWPVDSEVKTPSCVRAVDVPSDLSSPPPYEDYIAGLFWNRDWVLSGANPDTICLSRPLIGIERKRATITLPKANEGCSEVWITLVDDHCSIQRGCTYTETTEQLHRRLLDTLGDLVRRITMWEIWTNGAGVYTVYNPLIPGSPPVGFTKTAFRLFEPGEADIRITEQEQEAGLNDARSASVGLTVCGCINSLSSNDFIAFVRPPGMGNTKCELC